MGDVLHHCGDLDDVRPARDASRVDVGELVVGGYLVVVVVGEDDLGVGALARTLGSGGEESLGGEQLAIHVRGASLHCGPQRGEAGLLLPAVLAPLPGRAIGDDAPCAGSVSFASAAAHTPSFC